MKVGGGGRGGVGVQSEPRENRILHERLKYYRYSSNFTLLFKFCFHIVLKFFNIPIQQEHVCYQAVN